MSMLKMNVCCIARRSEFVNLNKTGLMYFNQDIAIFSLNHITLKFVDKLRYLNSNISSTKSDVTIYIGKA